MEKSDLRQIAELLAKHGVEFIVIGGQAEALMGSGRVTTMWISVIAGPRRIFSASPKRSRHFNQGFEVRQRTFPS